MPQGLIFLQWNYLGARGKLPSLLEATQQEGVNVFMLQETLLPLNSTLRLSG